MNNFPTAENIWFVEAHTCFQLFNFVCLAAISLKVSAKLTRNKFKNITASYLLTSYIISSVKMLRMSNPVLFTMVATDQSHHRNKTRKGQDHWFLPNQSDYSLFAALILLWYWNYNCVLQTNNDSSHWLGQNYISCPFLVTFLW